MDFVHIGLLVAGGFIGFGVNQMSLKLSGKLETIIGKVGKLGGNTARWVGWLLAVVFYAVVAGGGAYTLVKSIDVKGGNNYKPYIGAILTGFGAGGLVSELLFQMPDLTTIGS